MIFKKHKVLFLHYPKTGGNSIQDALREYSQDKIVATAPHQDGIERFGVRNLEYSKLRKHSKLQDYYDSIGDDLFKYKIFITIRNPYDRIVSYYFSPNRGSIQYNRDEFSKFIKTVQLIENYISIKRSFFGKFEIPKNLNFLKFEKLSEDFNVLLDAELQNIILPHCNASIHKKYTKYYDEELISVVSKIHKSEITIGNYSY